MLALTFTPPADAIDDEPLDWIDYRDRFVTLHMTDCLVVVCDTRRQTSRELRFKNPLGRFVAAQIALTDAKREAGFHE